MTRCDQAAWFDDASLGLENGNGGYQMSEIGAGLVKAAFIFADCLANLVALPA